MADFHLVKMVVILTVFLRIFQDKCGPIQYTWDPINELEVRFMGTMLKSFSEIKYL